MNCLITGANGFLGRILDSYLSSELNVTRLSKTSGEYIVDISKNIPSFNNSFELVIHAAGLAHVTSKRPVDQNHFFSVNVEGTVNLLRGLERVGFPDKFVLISSVSVYGRDYGNLIAESNKLMATDPYGSSKIMAESVVLDWCKLNNVKCTILRLPLIAGLNPPGNLGVMIKAITANFYFNIGGGKVRKSMVLAEDVARFILKAAEVGGVYNLTDGYHPSFYELSNCISAQLGKRKPLNLPFLWALVIAKIGDFLGKNFPLDSDKLRKITSNLTFDDSKARSSFGWDPIKVLEGLIVTNDDVK